VAGEGEIAVAIVSADGLVRSGERLGWWPEIRVHVLEAQNLGVVGSVGGAACAIHSDSLYLPEA
jgi:hypothetical protein